MTENWLADLHIYLLFKRVKSNGKESQSQDHSRRTQAEKDRKEVCLLYTSAWEYFYWIQCTNREVE